MTAPLTDFPVSAVVDGMLSYLQYIFKNIEITPSEYRWSEDDRQSKIRISGPFVIDNSKPMSAPFIVVERGGLQFDNRVIDNLKSANANDFTRPEFVAIANGTISITCGAKEGTEASSIANFISMMVQADRHAIMDTLKFLRNLYHIDISPEIPVVKDTEVRRWEVTVRMFISIQMGWIKPLREPQLWKSAHFYATDKSYTDTSLSDKGSVTAGSDLFVDDTQDFGLDVSNNPQLLSQELQKGWYYIRFKGEGESSQLYPVKEIVDNHTLKLLTHDINNDPIPWSATETKTDVAYDLLWNNIHLNMEIPKVVAP